VVALALRDAWAGRPRPIAIRVFLDAPLSAAIACAAHAALQASRTHSLVDSTVTVVGGVVSLLLLSLVRVSHAQANTPAMSVQSGGSGMQVTHADGSSNRWSALWLLALVPLGTAIGLGASYFSPPVYRASVSVLVLPSAQPAYMVPVDLSQRLPRRLQVTSLQVLSTARLEPIIQDFKLYERERQMTADAVAHMR
jgi:hypothetical protein